MSFFLYTPGEVATRLGLHPATVADWLRRGDGPPCEQTPDGPRLDLDQVIAWLDGRNRQQEMTTWR